MVNGDTEVAAVAAQANNASSGRSPRLSRPALCYHVVIV